MSRFKAFTRTPQFLVAQILLEIIVGLALIGLFIWVYTQSQTQHQICQLVGFVGDQTQHGIDTNAKLIRHDVVLGTKAAKADAQIRRASVSQATTFLIRVNKIHC